MTVTFRVSLGLSFVHRMRDVFGAVPAVRHNNTDKFDRGRPNFDFVIDLSHDGHL